MNKTHTFTISLNCTDCGQVIFSYAAYPLTDGLVKMIEILELPELKKLALDHQQECAGRLINLSAELLPRQPLRR